MFSLSLFEKINEAPWTKFSIRTALFSFSQVVKQNVTRSVFGEIPQSHRHNQTHRNCRKHTEHKTF